MAIIKIKNPAIDLDAAEIPGIDASKIISGDIAAARLSLATETKPVVSSISPSTITNDATNITITGTDFTAIPRVDIINTATGIWYSSNTVTHNSATSLTVNVTLPVDAGTYRIRVENPDGLAGLSAANFLTVSDAPTWTTSAGSLGTVAGDTNGAVASVAASGDSVTYSEVTNVLENASLANCSLNSSTGAITSTDFDGSNSSPRTHTFTIRATDAQGQTSDREFTLTSSYFTTASISWLVIAGGGGGGGPQSSYGGGGGGAGGYRSSWNSETSGGGASAESALTFNAGQTYTITVGNGGAGGSSGNNGTVGQDSSIAGSDITNIVSDGGAYGASSSNAGGSGGSGGGGAYNAYGGSGASGQGFDGGRGVTSGNDPKGGGGGAGGGGGDGSGNNGGAGGSGVASTITGSSVTRASGGGGGTGSGGTQGSSPAGGGSNAGAGNATANTGGGGGGASVNNENAGTGGSGVVILRMPTSAYNGKQGITGTYSASAVSTDTVVTWTASGNISF
tara:strand:+ start:667 stop:2196 length:1530 start_codon:yes stop_codon:yes gene_type:complete